MTRRRVISAERRKTVTDHGPAERWQHSGRALELTEHAGILAARVTEESVLDGLVTRGHIGAGLRDCALRLRRDYQAARVESRLIASYNAARSLNHAHDGGYERNDAEEAAYQRWRLAVRAVGAVDSNVLVTVCCQDIAPLLRQMPSLLRGLTRLAKWYGQA